MLIFVKSRKNVKVVVRTQTQSYGGIIKIFHGFSAKTNKLFPKDKEKNVFCYMVLWTHWKFATNKKLSKLFQF